MRNDHQQQQQAGPWLSRHGGGCWVLGTERVLGAGVSTWAAAECAGLLLTELVDVGTQAPPGWSWGRDGLPRPAVRGGSAGQ